MLIRIFTFLSIIVYNIDMFTIYITSTCTVHIVERGRGHMAAA